MKKEDQNIEYKQSWRDEYLKWVCGFANANGGRMLIGVMDDKEGALGIMTLTPSETAIIGADVALKAANVELVFVDRFSGSLVIRGLVADVEASLKEVNRVLASTIGATPAEITRS